MNHRIQSRDDVLPLPLIPGLPDDLGLLCLARLPRISYRIISKVSKSWNSVFRSKEFFKLRSSINIKCHWLFTCKQFVKTTPDNIHLQCYFYDFSGSADLITCPEIPPLKSEFSLSGLNSAQIGSEIYVVGGLPETRDYKRLDLNLKYQWGMSILDTTTLTWSKGPNPILRRSRFSTAAIDGKLYIASGLNSNSKHITGEVYDPSTKEWSMIAPMLFPFVKVETEVVFQGRWYMRGLTRLHPMLPASDLGFKAIQRYDPKTNVWENLTDMESGCRNGRFVANETRIFMMGKDDKIIYYSEETARWIEVTTPWKCSMTNMGGCKWACFHNFETPVVFELKLRVLNMRRLTYEFRDRAYGEYMFGQFRDCLLGDVESAQFRDHLFGDRGLVVSV